MKPEADDGHRVVEGLGHRFSTLDGQQLSAVLKMSMAGNDSNSTESEFGGLSSGLCIFGTEQIEDY